jgi:hypothetical protein
MRCIIIFREIAIEGSLCWRRKIRIRAYGVVIRQEAEMNVAASPVMQQIPESLALLDFITSLYQDRIGLQLSIRLVNRPGFEDGLLRPLRVQLNPDICLPMAAFIVVPELYFKNAASIRGEDLRRVVEHEVDAVMVICRIYLAKTLNTFEMRWVGKGQVQGGILTGGQRHRIDIIHVNSKSSPGTCENDDQPDGNLFLVHVTSCL